MTTANNPHLVGDLLDYLAALNHPASTSELSMALTSTMRRLVNRGIVENDDVMTWNSQGYWEVTGATVAAILDKQPEVAMLGVHKPTNGFGRAQKHWATKANAERWAREREAQEQALVEADTRFVIHEPNGFRTTVLIIDTARVGKVNTVAETAVASFDTTAIPLDVAMDLARRAKRALVRQTVAA